MNKTKISSKVKSLALLCLYTTIGLGGAAIVSSCGSEESSTDDAPKLNLAGDGEDIEASFRKNYPKFAEQFEKNQNELKTRLTKEEFDKAVEKAKQDADDKAKVAETKLGEAEESVAKYKKDAYLKYIMDVLIKINEKVGFSVVSDDTIPFKDEIELSFVQENIASKILIAINDFLTKKNGNDISEDELFDAVYISFETLLCNNYLVDINTIDYTKGFVIFMDKLHENKLFSTNISVTGMQDATGNNITSANVPLLICGNAAQQTTKLANDKITVVLENNPKDMLKDIFVDCLKTLKEDK